MYIDFIGVCKVRALDEWHRYASNKSECNNHSFINVYVADAIDPLLDTEPVDVRKIWSGLLQRKISAFKSVAALARTGEIILLIPIHVHETFISITLFYTTLCTCTIIILLCRCHSW